MLEHFLHRLREAETFAEVGVVICDYGRSTLDLYQTSVGLFTAARELALLVDNSPSETRPEQRLRYVAEFPIDPLLARLLADHAPVGENAEAVRMVEFLRRHVGYTGAFNYQRIVPLLGAADVLGFVRCGTAVPITRGLRRDVSLMSTYTSVWLARIGVTAVSDPLRALSGRQREIAELSSTGLTNREISDATCTSVNTVKKHLKDIFMRLSLVNRVELAALLARRGPRDDVPTGVTALETAWVTKAALPRRAHQQV